MSDSAREEHAIASILLAFVLVVGASYALASPQRLVSDSGGDWVYVDHEPAGTRYSHLNVAVVSGYVGVYNLVAPASGGGNTTVSVFRLPRLP